MTTFAQEARFAATDRVSMDRRTAPQLLAHVVACLRAEFVGHAGHEITHAVMNSWTTMRFFGLDRDPDAQTLTAALARSEIQHRLAVSKGCTELGDR
jgi:hypothetical protein